MPGTTPALPARIKANARKLRQRQTDAETLVWQLLRNRALDGWKFRRQHPIPPYVLDFYCHDARLAVELDGGQHADAVQYEERRAAYLAAAGIRVLRSWDDEVLKQTEAVLEAIWRALQETRGHDCDGRCAEEEP
jgi:very-short-patch-repair endonuclease